jgi:hypothetical protein
VSCKNIKFNSSSISHKLKFERSPQS